MKVSLFYLPSIGSRAEIERGLAGLRPDLYQRMLAELSAQAQLADILGYDSISFTEHHFHSRFALGDGPAHLPQTLQVARDGLTNVRDRLPSGTSHGGTPWQVRHIGRVAAVRFTLDDCRELPH